MATVAEASTTEGTCLVCGEPAALRCSACFERAAIELRYCGTVHQKILWPFHKQVCGANAHPFRLPPFSREEAADISRELSAEARSAEQIRLQREYCTALEINSPPSQAVKTAALQDLLGVEMPAGCAHFELLACPTDPPHRVRTLRKIHGCWQHTLPSFMTTPRPLVNSFPNFYDRFTTDNACPIDINSTWFSVFCHRITATSLLSQQFFAAISRVPRPPADHPDDLLFKRYLHGLLTFLHGSKVTTPRIAERVDFCDNAIEGIETYRRYMNLRFMAELV